MSKYHAVKVEADGYIFDSKAEHRRYVELKLLLAYGEINHLEVHPLFNLVVNGHKVGTYSADFEYRNADGDKVVEDVKGVKTAVYQLKKKMIKAQYGITITEVSA